MNIKHTKRIAIWGATGLAGSGVLDACLSDPNVSEVVAVTRRSLNIKNAKLREIICNDFGNLSPIIADIGVVDACFYCLGVASSGFKEAAYRVITKDYALEAARCLKATSPALAFHFISGASTHIKSRMMWARVKAETEEALKNMGLASIICWRPAMILGDRPPSTMPWVMRVAYPLLRLMRFVPSLSIESKSLGFAMLQLTFEEQKEGTLENKAIRAAAKRYQPSINPRP